MNDKKLSLLWVWLLLPIFGIPSIGGWGLHLFLAEEGVCLCHTHGHALPAGHDAEDRADISADSEFPIRIFSAPVIHDKDHCFLCHFLAQPPIAAKSAPLPPVAMPVDTVVDLPNCFFAAEPVLHSGRSPPDFLS